MDSLLQLAERCEAAEAENRELFVEAAKLIFGPEPASDYQPRREPNFSPDWSAWTKRRCRFQNLLQFEAYESAAMMLVPEGWIVDLCIRLGMEQHECKLHEWPQPCRKTPLVNAATPALALCAAALRARHSQGVSDNG